MGNGAAKQQSRDRPRKNVHWKTAEPPSSPGKPILVSGAQDTPDVVTIRWDRPKSDGGAPILGYLVEHRRTGSPHWVRAYPNLVPHTELALSGLEPGWRYQFRVTAENVVGKSDASETSDPLTVTLQRNAIAAPRFNAELCDTVAIENEKMEFQVSVTGTPSPEINWFKDGFEIFSSRRTKIVSENDTSTLVFHETALTDEGEIKCTATNRAGHAVTKGQLRIEAPPKIRLPRNYEDGLLIEADEDIKLKVGIAGRPSPSVSWHHNGEVISADARFEIETTDKNSSLRVLNARREDRGEYNIRAVNKLGEDNGSVLVTVTARPSPPASITVAMTLGKSVTLSWNAPEDDGGCKIGNYTVEYFRMGWNMWLKAVTTRSLSATLSDLIEGSEYKFRVKAENPYGMSEPSEESSVLFIPDPKRGINKPGDNEEKQNNPLDNKPSAPRRRRISPLSSSNHSLEDGSMGRSTAEKGEQTHMARLRIQKSTVNVQLIPEVFDSDTIARDMSYGSPDPTMKDRIPSKEKIIKDRSPVPGRELLVSTTTVNTLLLQPSLQPLRPRSVSPKKVEPPAKPPNEHYISVERDIFDKITPEKVAPVNIAQEKVPSAKLLPTQVTDHIKDYSSLKDGGQKEAPKPAPNRFSFEFDDDELMLPPPPLSISAPELSAEPPSVPLLKRSVSSTELLYEKAMARFYKAMELDEKEQLRKKSVGSKLEMTPITRESTPKATLSKRNSIGSTGSLERKSSLRRRLSGEPPEININFSHLIDSSKESVNQVPQKHFYPQESFDDADYPSHVDEYTDDYTESTASSGESETEKFKRRVREHGQHRPATELDTYHPLNRMSSPYTSPDSDQAAEVLSKPYSLPSPDFVPKPILKRPPSVESDSGREDKRGKAKAAKTKTQRNTLSKLFDRKSSAGEIKEPKELKTEKPETASVEATKDVEIKPPIEQPKDKGSGREKAKLLKLEMRQSSIEEEKVVIDHYSDLVKEKGNWRKAAVPLYLSADELKKAAALDGNESLDEYEDERFKAPIDPTNLQPSTTPNPPDDMPLLSPSTRTIISQPRPALDRHEVIQIPTSRKSSIEDKSVEEMESRGRRKAPEQAPLKRDTSSRSASRQGPRTASTVRRTSKTPVEARVASKTRERSTSKSPLTVNRRPLSVTRQQNQLNGGMHSKEGTPLRRTPTPSLSRPMTPEEQEQQQQDIDIKVKGTISYTTDLVLFTVACWVYLFKDARLALPIVLLLVYRQISEYLPQWLVKRLNCL